MPHMAGLPKKMDTTKCFYGNSFEMRKKYRKRREFVENIDKNIKERVDLIYLLWSGKRLSKKCTCATLKNAKTSFKEAALKHVWFAAKSLKFG